MTPLQTPEESSFVYGITGYNLTYYGFSEVSNCTYLCVRA